MKRNKFSKALKQLKSTELDERIKSLEESAPTNSIGGVYALNQPGQRLGPYDPPKVFYPDADGNWPDGIPGTPGEKSYTRPAGHWEYGPGAVPSVDWDNTVDFSHSGTSTDGFINPTDGTVLSNLPPDSSSFILGPLVDGYTYNHGYDDFTNIGYIQKDTRQFVLLARIQGYWKSGSAGNAGAGRNPAREWGGETDGFTSYNENFTLAMAQWFRDQYNNGTYVKNVSYFYNGGQPQSDNPDPNAPPGSKGGIVGGAGSGGGPDEEGPYGSGTSNGDPNIGTPQNAPNGGGPEDAGFPWGMIGYLNTGTLAQLGSRLLRSFTDAARFSGDYMFKGIKAGVEYLPDFTGAAPKSLGGKKWADVFGPLGKALAGKNYASQYFTPSLNKALDYAKEGGTIVVMPRTGGVRGFKNWFGSSVSRGFGIGDIEKLVRTSDTIKSAQQGTTQIFNSADPKSMEALKKLAASGSKANTMLGKLGRAVPFVGGAAAVADVSMRLNKGDYTGAILGGVSAIPGPIGWIGLGSQVLYDTAVPGWLKDSVNRGVKTAYVDPANQGMQNMMNTGNMSRSGGVPTGTGTLLNFGVEYEINSNQRFLNEQVDYDEYRNSMRTALFELGVPTDRKQFAKEQGTYLTLLGVNPDLVSILTLTMAGEELSSEQKKWIDDNLINMVKVFSNLRDEQEQNPKTKKESNDSLTESRKRIIREVKKPYQDKEEKKEKLKGYRPRVIGIPGTPIDNPMKKIECPSSFKPMEERMWGKYEKRQNARASQERLNQVGEYVLEGGLFWEFLNKRENARKSKNILEFYGELPDKKIVRRENVRNDSILFLVDENGKTETLLQSEYNEMMDERINKQLFAKYLEEQESKRDPLFKRVSQKINPAFDYPNRPSKDGYPDTPPPEMVNGYHPDLVDGKSVANRFNRLDPISAEAMPPTGNPEIDAKVQKARRIKRIVKGA